MKNPTPIEPIGPNFFALNAPLSLLEQELLMRFETWSWWQRQGWRLRYLWARLRGKHG